MRNNRGIDRDIGALPRQLADLRKQIDAVKSERRAAATEITEGDFTVSGGGSVIVNDGGSVAINDGGSVNVHDGGSIVVDDNGTITVEGPTSSAVLSDGSLGVIDHTNWPASFVKKNEFRLLPTSVAAPVVYGFDPVSGSAKITAPALMIPVIDTGLASNMHIEPNGVVYRVVSSGRYKQDVEPVEIDPAAVLQLVGKTWRQRSEVDADPETETRYVGFIAEDLDEIGLTQFVDYDDQGRPDAIQYDRLSVALLALAKDQQTRLDNVEARLDRLET